MKSSISRGYRCVLAALFVLSIIITNDYSHSWSAGPGYLRVPESSDRGFRRSAPGTDDDAALLSDHLMNFIQSGATLAEIEPTHAIYPLSKVPLLATTVYLLVGHDSVTLSRIYPDLLRTTMERFDPENLTAAGIIPGSCSPSAAGKIALSPTVNALATLELYSLHLMASKLEKHEDAIELLSGSRRLSSAVTAAFYNPSRSYFFPLDGDGNFVISYAPEQLLPLLFEQNLGDGTHQHILQTILILCKTYGREGKFPMITDSMLSDPFLRPVLIDLLYTIPGFSDEMLDAIDSAFGAGKAPSQPLKPAYRHWITFWIGRPSSHRHLFPSWRVISGLVHLTKMLERESLLEMQMMTEMRADVDSLTAILSLHSPGFDSYTRALTASNRLLVKISQLTASIKTGAEHWKGLDALKWKRISPRTRRLISVSCSLVPDEITRAKVAMSKNLADGTGMKARFHLPKHPILIGRPIEFKVSIKSTTDTLTISRAYLQVDETRKRITGDNEDIVIRPGSPTYIYDGKLPLPPTHRFGVWPLHIYLDFMLNGKRIEFHSLESISVTKAYDISINYPIGRKLAGAPLPILVTLKIKPEHDTRGTVEGSFFKELSCSPKLPARFLVKAGTESTTLPVTVSSSAETPPGTYPFSLSVEYDGKTIGSFEDKLVQPMRWFYLGPLTIPSFKPGSIMHYQDNLDETYTSTGGRPIKWREVSTGAIDEAGRVLPERLIGTTSNDCILLYTVIKARDRMTASWKFNTPNKSALWINSELALSTEDGTDHTFTGVIDLRKGINSFLVASCRKTVHDRIFFELSDQNGLPIHGITNEVDKTIEQVAGYVADSDQKGLSPDRLREIVLTLEYTNTTQVSVIGSFNNWDPDATIMKKNEHGVWTATLFLSPGRYTYKYLIDGSTKITDPVSDLIEPDGFGGLSSVLVVD